MTAPADLWTDHTTDDTEAVAWHAGYTDGHTAGLAARPPSTVWAPHTVRWRHARPGDAFTGHGGQLWHIADIGGSPDAIAVRAMQGARQVPVTVDPDEPVTLLLPVDERDAIALTADLLGARIIDRREQAVPG